MLSSPALHAGLLVVATAAVVANAEPAESVPETSPESAPGAGRWRESADYWHDRLYFWVQRELQQLDGALAPEVVDDPPADSAATADIEPRSPFRLELDLSAGDLASEQALSSSVRFDIDLQLPRLERRLRVFLTTDDVSETLSDVADELRGGVRLRAFADAEVELGIKLDTPPVAYAALRWGREHRRGPWWIHPFAKVFIDSSDGPGVSSALVIDRWQDEVLWRSSSTILGLPRDSRTLWNQSWVIARTNDILFEGRPLTRVGSRDIVRGWGVEFSVAGEGGRTLERELALFYKRPLQSDWLFVSFRPFWRSSRAVGVERGWEQEMGVRVGLDLLFWAPAGQRSNAPK